MSTEYFEGTVTSIDTMEPGMITFVGKDGKEMRGLLFDLPEAEVGDLIVLTLHQTIEKIVRESI